MYPLNAQISLLTKHAKAAQISPVLASAWSGELIVTEAFDTDQLGSFDNTVKRTLLPHQCAIKKAQIACELTGLSQGIGSEGSFVGVAGVGNTNEEFVAFVDLEHAVTVVGRSNQFVNLSSHTVSSADELNHILAGYPTQQAWMLCTSEQDSRVLQKGLFSADAIRDAHANEFPLTIVPDFRAMHCPVRQQNIIKATEDLLWRLQSLCPNCHAPDFVADKKQTGLPCELCASPTNQVKATITKCARCGLEHQHPVPDTQASSFYCNYCNP